jgi:DNA-binding XRE family transcriptional regulator
MAEQTQPGEQWVIYNRIGELRRSGGLSQKELASRLSINPLTSRTVGLLEGHDQRVDLRLAWKIADLFGVELGDVFYRAGGTGD